MIIKFNTVEKEDEFYLHCQQIALKCWSLSLINQLFFVLFKI